MYKENIDYALIKKEGGRAASKLKFVEENYFSTFICECEFYLFYFENSGR